jgi:AmmeMemoRadiSam system protein A
MDGEPRECITAGSTVGPSPEEDLVSPADRMFILTMCRKILDEYIITRKYTIVEPVPPLLKEKLGLFVTLKKHGELRGCIGYIQPVTSLERALYEMTIASATQDSRFPPVTPAELKEIRLEVSILTPLRRIEDPDTIVMGKHGVYVKRGFRSGVFLPQVATETGWDRETFLRNLCRGKACIHPEAWRDPDTELYVFTVEHFEEEE